MGVSRIGEEGGKPGNVNSENRIRNQKLKSEKMQSQHYTTRALYFGVHL